jgi:hypothetical protein
MKKAISTLLAASIFALIAATPKAEAWNIQGIPLTASYSSGTPRYVEALTKRVIVEGACYLELREIYGPLIQAQVDAINNA